MRATVSQGRFPPPDEFATLAELIEKWDAEILSGAVETAKRINVEGHTLNEVRLRNELVRLALLELELQDRKDELIFAHVAKSFIRDVLQRIRDGLMSLPARHAPILAAKYGADPHAMYLDIETIVRDFSTRISDDVDIPKPKPGIRARKREG